MCATDTPPLAGEETRLGHWSSASHDIHEYIEKKREALDNWAAHLKQACGGRVAG